ncbi:MAG: hypothetical protein ABEJ92_06210 [Halobacteriales archaeon]
MIGAGVFLLVVGFVLGIIPGIIDPFSDSQETTIVADRLATQVAEGMLGEPSRPTVLNETCTFAFFNASLGNGEGCPVPFHETTNDLNARLGVQDRQSINITIKRDLDADGDLEQLATDGDTVSTTGHTTLAIGPAVPPSRSVVAASRTAFIDGKDVTVVVRVW